MNRRVAAVVIAAVTLQPFNPYGVVGPVSVADLALVGALAVVVGHQALADDGFLALGARPLLILIGGLMAWFAIAADGWHVTQFAAFTLVIALVGLFARDRAHVEAVLWGLALGGFIAAVLTLYSTLFDPSFGGRVAGARGIGPIPTLPRTIGIPTGSFGAFSTYLLAGWPFLIVRFWRSRRPWLLIPTVTIFAGAVIFQSRATWLAILAAVGVLFVGVSGRRVWDAGWRNAGVSMVILLSGTGIGLAGAWFLIQINRANALSRLGQFQRSVVVFFANPLTGITPPVIQHFPVTENIPHNVVLLVAVVGGVPALTLLLTIFAATALGLVRAWRDDDTRWTALAIAGGLAATLTNLSLAPGFTRSFWALVALGAVFIHVDGGTVDMEPWYQRALSGSRLVSTLRRWAQGSVLVSLLTTDATGTQRKFAIAWKNSRCRGLSEKLRAAWSNSRVVSVLFAEN
jgi:hypothetical protein